jgi:hypothetical protein
VGKLRKVVLKPHEVLDCLKAFGGEEQPATATSHRKYHCWVRGQKKIVTFDTGTKEFLPETFGPLWGMVIKQLGISWQEFYAADHGVAKRAGIPHVPPAR